MRRSRPVCLPDDTEPRGRKGMLSASDVTDTKTKTINRRVSMKICTTLAVCVMLALLVAGTHAAD